MVTCTLGMQLVLTFGGLGHTFSLCLTLPTRPDKILELRRRTHLVTIYE